MKKSTMNRILLASTVLAITLSISLFNTTKEEKAVGFNNNFYSTVDIDIKNMRRHYLLGYNTAPHAIPTEEFKIKVKEVNGDKVVKEEIRTISLLEDSYTVLFKEGNKVVLEEVEGSPLPIGLKIAKSPEVYKENDILVGTSPKTNLVIEKVWEDEEIEKPESIDVKITRKIMTKEYDRNKVLYEGPGTFILEDENFTKTITLTKDENWKKVIENVEIFSKEDGVPYLYEVEYINSIENVSSEVIRKEPVKTVFVKTGPRGVTEEDADYTEFYSKYNSNEFKISSKLINKPVKEVVEENKEEEKQDEDVTNEVVEKDLDKNEEIKKEEEQKEARPNILPYAGKNTNITIVSLLIVTITLGIAKFKKNKSIFGRKNILNRGLRK